jgi:hypothetical protein
VKYDFHPSGDKGSGTLGGGGGRVMGGLARWPGDEQAEVAAAVQK